MESLYPAGIANRKSLRGISVCCGSAAARLRQAQATDKNGGDRIRTDDPLLAKQVLYQLSYAPTYRTGSRRPRCGRDVIVSLR